MLIGRKLWNEKVWRDDQSLLKLLHDNVWELYRVSENLWIIITISWSDYKQQMKHSAPPPIENEILLRKMMPWSLQMNLKAISTQLAVGT